METGKSKFVSVTLDEEVPQHVLRTEDNFDSDEDLNWETDPEEEEDDDDYEDYDDIDQGEEFEEEIGDSGWADAMAKILKTKIPDDKSSGVLAKAKKISDFKPKEEDSDFEIVGENKEKSTEVKQEIKEELESKEVIQEKLKSSRIHDKNKEWSLIGRIKPNILEKNREKVLTKIATKGVIQLFNGVREQQKKMNAKLNSAGSVRKEEKILQSFDKKAFLNMITSSKGENTSRNNSAKIEPKVEVKEEDPAWNVLREDFMMGANLKDWDKEPE